MTLHPDVQALLVALRELQKFLEQHGQSFWSAKIAQAADEIARSDAHGVRRFLGFFGGMGSLNDLYLIEGGRTLPVEQDRLDALRSNAYSLAQSLKNETF